MCFEMRYRINALPRLIRKLRLIIYNFKLQYSNTVYMDGFCKQTCENTFVCV